MKNVDKSAFGKRLREKREAAGLSQGALAKAVGMRQQGIASIEEGKVERPRLLREIAEELQTSEDALLYGAASPQSRSAPNAVIGNVVALEGRIPLYGQAAAGKDGRFVLNGNEIGDVVAPPSLVGVRDAYAVLVAGDSAEPKYSNGNTVYVHPRRPVGRGDWVVVQVHGEEGAAPDAYIKKFISLDSRLLKVEQLNPKKTLTFPARKVMSVHKIIMGGDG